MRERSRREPRVKLPAPRRTTVDGGVARNEARKFLAQAFVSFTEAAGSLEKSYGQLQGEVTRLRAELERANSELAASLAENAQVRRFLARVLEGLPCGVLALAEGEVRLANPEAARLLGIGSEWKPGEEAMPQPIVRLLQTETREPDGRRWEYATGEGAAARTLAVTASDVAEAEGTVGGQIVILRDVTEEKRLAAEREAARRVQALAEISTLLAHEIRNPLGSMELFAGLIADSTAEMPEVRKWVDHLQAGLRGLSATANNVLQFHSEPSPQLVPTLLDRLLRETVEFLRPLARQRCLQASVINRVGTVEIVADPHRLRQAFFNLSLNAFRSMSAGGTVYVRLDWAPDAEGRCVQVEVEDNGCGISAEHLEHIFDPGYTTHAGSPGLGLAVVKTVAEQHGASLAVRSTPGRGTTFTLTFPVRGEAG
jgi:two-component system sensor histidine kinase FlrB